LTTDNGALLDTHYPMTSVSYQIMMHRIPIAPGTTIGSTPQAGTFVFATAVEFTTTDTTREVTLPTGSSMAMIQVQDTVRAMRQYSENPGHYALILEAVRKALNTGARFVLGALPSVRRGAQALANLTD